MPDRAVPAVVGERDRLGERDVQPAAAGDADRHLRDLDRVREPGALVVLGERRTPGTCPPGAGTPGAVQDPVEVALEAHPERVGLLGHAPGGRPHGPGRARRELRVLQVLPLLPVEQLDRADLRRGVRVAPAGSSPAAKPSIVAAQLRGPLGETPASSWLMGSRVPTRV